MSSFALTNTCFPACHYHFREVPLTSSHHPTRRTNPPDPRSGSIAAAPTHPVAGGEGGLMKTARPGDLPPVPNHARQLPAPRPPQEGNSMLSYFVCSRARTPPRVGRSVWPIRA